MAAGETGVSYALVFLYALVRLPGMFLTTHEGAAETTAPSDYTNKNNLAAIMDYHYGVKSIDYHLGNSAYPPDDLTIGDGVGRDLSFESGWTNGEVYWDDDDGGPDSEWDYTDAGKEEMDLRAQSGRTETGTASRCGSGATT